jgi:hypothetical protein
MRRTDVPAFCKAVECDYEYLNDEDPNSAVAELAVEEANYAWCSELQKAAAEGIRFTGNHSEGGEYSAEEFTTHMRNVRYLTTDRGDPVVPVRINEYGKASIDPSILRGVEAFEKARRATDAFIDKANKTPEASNGK